MIQGLAYALLAGTLISFHNIFVSRTGERLGFWETTTLVHGLGFLLGFSILFFVGRSESGSSVRDINILYLIGCAVGVIIVFSVMQGVTRLGVLFAVPLIIGAQVIGSVIISHFGLFEEKIVLPSMINIIGLVLLIVGVVLSQVR